MLIKENFMVSYHFDFDFERDVISPVLIFFALLQIITEI